MGIGIRCPELMGIKQQAVTGFVGIQTHQAFGQRGLECQPSRGERLGQVAFDAARPGAYLAVSQAPQQINYSEETARIIDEEVGRLIREAHDRVTETLSAKRDILESLARLLLVREVVDRTALDELLRPKQDLGRAAPGGKPKEEAPAAAGSQA